MTLCRAIGDRARPDEAYAARDLRSHARGSRTTWPSLRMSEKPKMETTMNSIDPNDTRAWVLVPAAQPFALQANEAAKHRPER